MGYEIRERKIQTIEYLSGGAVTKTIPRGTFIRDLELRLKCTPTIAAADNTIDAVKRGGPWAVVKSITIMANGTDMLRRFSGTDLWWINRFLFNCWPHVSVAYGNAAANPVADETLIIPFWMLDNLRPVDTMLDTRLMTSLDITVEWGTYQDICQEATAWTTQPTLEVNMYECWPTDQREIAIAGTRISKITAQIAAANSNAQIQLQLGPLYRSMIVNVTGTTGLLDKGLTPGSTPVVQNLRLVSGGTSFIDKSAFALWQGTQLRRSAWSPLVRAASTGAYDEQQQSGLATALCLQTAWFFLDLCKDGYLSEGVDSYGRGDLFLEVDATEACTVSIIPVQIFPVRAVKK